MGVNAQEVASALVRFVGDLKPLEKDTQQAKKTLDTLSKHNFGKTLSDGALSAGRSMLDLSKNIFYVREALQTVISLAGTFARAFLQPAMELEKTRNALIGIMGSSEQADALLGQLSDTADRFGLNLKDLQGQAVSLAVISEGDITMANEYAMALARINSLRPDLPQQRQLGVIFALREGDFSRASMLLDVPKEKLEELAGVASDAAGQVSSETSALVEKVARLTDSEIAKIRVAVDEGTEVPLSYFGDLSKVSKETADAINKAIDKVAWFGEKQLGTYTSVSRSAGETSACGKNLAENLKKGLSTGAINDLLAGLGASDKMMSLVGNSMSNQLQKLQNQWLEFRQTVGLKVLEALAGPFNNLLNWLQDNEDMVIGLAEAFGTWLAGGIQKFLEWLTLDKLDAIANSIMNIASAVGDLIARFAAMPAWAQKLMIGGAVALGPGGGGRLLGGLALKGAGKLLGGGAAAGAGEAAAGGAAAAGGVTGLGVAGSILGGVGLGLAGNEAISRTQWGQEHGVQSTRNVLSVGAYGLGSLLGGEELGNKWFSGVSGIQPGQKQEVEVHVTVDDEGALRAYTQDEIGRNNSDIVSGWAGGGPSSASFAAWSGAGV